MTKARQLADLGNAYDDGALSNRNLIINGAMQVAQRSTSTSTASTGYHTLDRYKLEMNGGNPTVTMSQDTASTPDTFTHALKLQVTSTATPSGFNFAQKIEGYNFSSAGFGKATAKDVTLSFWVRSSITGTYSTVLMNSSANRSYVNEYTINTADTWEKKTITIDGDTTGTWPSTSGMSLQLFFCLDNNDDSYTTSTIGSWIASNKYAGSTNQVNWAGTNGATFYMTGVQLEVGDTATPFEHRSYGDELAKCQRYYSVIKPVQAHPVWTYTSTNWSSTFPHPTTMRVVPSISFTGSPVNTAGGSVLPSSFAVYSNGAWKGLATLTPSQSASSVDMSRIDGITNDSMTSGYSAGFYMGSDCSINMDAEL